MKAAPLCLLAGLLMFCASGSALAEEQEAQLARMRALSQARQWKEQIAQFGREDFVAWPAEQAAAALQLRGQAYTFLKDGEHAKADLSNASQLAPQDVVIWLTLAENYL